MPLVEPVRSDKYRGGIFPEAAPTGLGTYGARVGLDYNPISMIKSLYNRHRGDVVSQADYETDEFSIFRDMGIEFRPGHSVDDYDEIANVKQQQQRTGQLLQEEGAVGYAKYFGSAAGVDLVTNPVNLAAFPASMTAKAGILGKAAYGAGSVAIPETAMSPLYLDKELFEQNPNAVRDTALGVTAGSALGAGIGGAIGLATRRQPSVLEDVLESVPQNNAKNYDLRRDQFVDEYMPLDKLNQEYGGLIPSAGARTKAPSQKDLSYISTHMEYRPELDDVVWIKEPSANITSKRAQLDIDVDGKTVTLKEKGSLIGQQLKGKSAERLDVGLREQYRKIDIKNYLQTGEWTTYKQKDITKWTKRVENEKAKLESDWLSHNTVRNVVLQEEGSGWWNAGKPQRFYMAGDKSTLNQIDVASEHSGPVRTIQALEGVDEARIEQLANDSGLFNLHLDFTVDDQVARALGYSQDAGGKALLLNKALKETRDLADDADHHIKLAGDKIKRDFVNLKNGGVINDGQPISYWSYSRWGEDTDESVTVNFGDQERTFSNSMKAKEYANKKIIDNDEAIQDHYARQADDAIERSIGDPVINNVPVNTKAALNKAMEACSL